MPHRTSQWSIVMRSTVMRSTVIVMALAGSLGLAACSAKPATTPTGPTPPQSAATPARGAMNTSQLAGGNYTSIAGHWRNAQGATITIAGDKITTSGSPVIAAGTYPLTKPQVDSRGGSIQLSGSGINTSPPALILVPAGIAAASPCASDPTNFCDNDRSDSSKDRIALQTDGGTDAWANPDFAPTVYYWLN